MLQAKLEMEPSANGERPHGLHEGRTHIQIWSKAKIFQKGRTDFILNQNDRY